MKTGRPIGKLNNKAPYFRHFNTDRIMDEIQLLESEFGLEGYAIYFKLWEKMISTDGWRLDLDPKRIGIYANDIGISRTKLQEFIAKAVEIEAFTRDENKLYSEELESRMEILKNKRQQNKDDYEKSKQKKTKKQKKELRNKDKEQQQTEYSIEKSFSAPENKFSDTENMFSDTENTISRKKTDSADGINFEKLKEFLSKKYGIAENQKTINICKKLIEVKPEKEDRIKLFNFSQKEAEKTDNPIEFTETYIEENMDGADKKNKPGFIVKMLEDLTKNKSILREQVKFYIDDKIANIEIKRVLEKENKKDEEKKKRSNKIIELINNDSDLKKDWKNWSQNNGYTNATDSLLDFAENKNLNILA